MSTVSVERERAVDTIFALLQAFRDNMLLTVGGVSTNMECYKMFKNSFEWKRLRLFLIEWFFFVFAERFLILCLTLTKVNFFFLKKTTSFSMAGPLLARLIPRCTDPVIIIRQTAVDCVQCVLKIAARFEGILDVS